MAAVTPVRNTGVSPSSSPRLPSPPPMPELQFGPQSPLLGSSATELQADTANKPDDSAQRRIRPGTRAEEMARGPPLVPLNQLDSPFQLQEHLKALYASLTHGQSDEHVVPITRETALSIATPPQINDGEYVDKNLWLYELCRFLTMKANYVSCALMADSDPCTAQSCPEMRASEWQYLCAVHEPPKSCCAIDYVNHTLDWAANVLTSPKHFPSRLQLGGDPGTAFQSMRQLTNVFRRVYRIFAHAWFQHREVFWQIEATFGIYILFKTICEEYSLIPKDNYTIPAEAEGPREEAESDQISRSENSSTPHQNGHEADRDDDDDGPANVAPAAAATTRRHKHTPSTGSHVGTIAEGAEEEDERSSSPSKQSRLSPERGTARDQLGRLDIDTADPAYLSQQSEDPTPTTAQASTEDPLDAAGKLTASGSSFESEVRSPTGGSIRTGGPDLLGAILGHMEGEPQNDLRHDAAAKLTTLNQEKSVNAAAGSAATKEAQEVTLSAEDDEEEEEAHVDNEAMERIDLPDRTKTESSQPASSSEGAKEGVTEEPVSKEAASLSSSSSAAAAATAATATKENAAPSVTGDAHNNDENDEGEVVELQLEQDKPVKESEAGKTTEDTSAQAVSKEKGDDDDDDDDDDGENEDDDESQQRRTDSGVGVQVSASG